MREPASSNTVREVGNLPELVFGVHGEELSSSQFGENLSEDFYSLSN